MTPPMAYHSYTDFAHWWGGIVNLEYVLGNFNSFIYQDLILKMFFCIEIKWEKWFSGENSGSDPKNKEPSDQYNL